MRKEITRARVEELEGKGKKRGRAGARATRERGDSSISDAH